MTVRSDAISAEGWEFLRRSLGLSLLQTEIVRRLFQGKSCQEIAREMGIRPRMVRTQVDRLHRALGVSNRLQLVLHMLVSLREHWEEGGEYLST
jgi:DNA-binding CsgD family transcriptional regulator